MSLELEKQSERNQTPKHSILLGLVLGLAWTVNSFADSTLTYVAVTSQTPASINPGASATYRVMANRTGTGSLDVYCSVSGLPAGATATFSPAIITFLDGSPPAKSATLTISTSQATPAGIYTFTITGKHGNSSKSVTCTGTLVIDARRLTDLPQRIVAIECQAEGSTLLHCSGKAGHSYVIQTSTSLAAGAWTNLATREADSNGTFTYLDTGAVGGPCRFYRTSTP